MNRNPIMTINTNAAKVVIELYPKSAPNAVASVIDIANKGWYDNQKIQRIAPRFVIQPSFTCFDDKKMAMEIPGEFAANGFQDGAEMKEGSVAMGGDGKIASGSEFFFCLTDEAGKSLQGKFPVIGQVIEGWEEILRIEKVPSHRHLVPDRDDVIVYIPDNAEYMKKVHVNTFGIQYPKPTIIGYQNV